MNQFFVYWSLAFTIILIFLASLVVAGLDLRDDILGQIKKAREARARGRRPLAPPDPMAGKTVAATVVPGVNRELTATEQWVRDVVGDVARALNIQARILVLQDSMDHPLVHFADRKRLLTLRVDKAWAAEGMAGSEERVRFVKDVVERFLRSEWLGESGVLVKVTELNREAKAKAAPAAPAADPSAAPAAQPAMSREEQIAAAKARAEAIKAQRAAAVAPAADDQSKSEGPSDSGDVAPS